MTSKCKKHPFQACLSMYSWNERHIMCTICMKVWMYGDVWRSMNVCMYVCHHRPWQCDLVTWLPSWCLHHQGPLLNKHPTLSPTDANPVTVSPRWGTSTVLCWKWASVLHLSWHVWLEASQGLHMFEPPLRAFASDNHAVFLLIILHLWTCDLFSDVLRWRSL